MRGRQDVLRVLPARHDGARPKRALEMASGKIDPTAECLYELLGVVGLLEIGALLESVNARFD